MKKYLVISQDTSGRDEVVFDTNSRKAAQMAFNNETHRTDYCRLEKVVNRNGRLENETLDSFFIEDTEAKQ